MNIGYHIVEQELAEKALADYRARQVRERTTVLKPAARDLRTQLAEVERQIAEVKARLDKDPGDDPALWPLRKKLVGLWRKHRDLLDQLEGGTHR